MRGLPGCQDLESMGATEELSLSECLKFYNAPEGPAWGLKHKNSLWGCRNRVAQEYHYNDIPEPPYKYACSVFNTFQVKQLQRADCHHNARFCK